MQQSSPSAAATPAIAPLAEWGEHSRVLRIADFPPHHNANGSDSVLVARGALATGERVRVHESLQPAGTAPPPLHPIAHTEFLCIREGEVVFAHDGREEHARAGDILFVSKGTVHQVRVVGDAPAKYFVVGIGGDV